ncbi:MAG: hypothetical protein NTZ42_00305 [Candidatus Gribaldobacteria bacterium]|nr:hypothetical protein [Candidatus Gribaldobacteria bacterium]
MAPDFLNTTELNAVGGGVKNVLRILLSSDLQRQLWPLQIVFVILAIFFIWMTVYYSLKTSYWDNRFLGDAKNFLFPKFFERKSQTRRWQKIQDGLETNHQDHWKLSLIDGATFLDESLKSAGFGGANLEERLQKVAVEDLSNLTALRNAQKVCSDVVHDPNYHLTKSMAKDVIDQFGQALAELGVL